MVMELAQGDGWSGTATDLLDTLVRKASSSQSFTLPKTPAGLRSALNKLKPNLRRAGIDVVFARRQGKQADGPHPTVVKERRQRRRRRRRTGGVEQTQTTAARDQGVRRCSPCPVSASGSYDHAMRRRGRIVAHSFVAFLKGVAVAVGVQIAVIPLLLALTISSQNVGAISGGFAAVGIFPVLGLIVWAVVMLPVLLVLDRTPVVARRSRLALGVVLGSITWVLFSVIVWPGRPASFAAGIFEWFIPTAMMGVAMLFYRAPPDV